MRCPLPPCRGIASWGLRSRGDVDRLLAGLARAGYAAAKTIRLTLSVLRRSLRRAQRGGLTSRNVAELAELPAGAKTRKSRAMTTDQVAALLALDLSLAARYASRADEGFYSGFAAHHGADLAVAIDSARATNAQLAATSRCPGRR